MRYVFSQINVWPFFCCTFPPRVCVPSAKARLCFICINQKVRFRKQISPPDRTPGLLGVAPPTPKKAEEGPGVPSTCRHGDALRNRFIDSAACVGHVTHVCPPFPQVGCRPQGDLFGGSGRPRTFLRSTSTTTRGNSRTRHGGSNRHPQVSRSVAVSVWTPGRVGPLCRCAARGAWPAAGGVCVWCREFCS